MAHDPISAWTEVQVDDDSISITLLTEGSEGGARVEEQAQFTFSQLQKMDGAIETLRLSQDTKDALRSDEGQSGIGQSGIGESEGDTLPSAGDILIDKRAPDWSDDFVPKVVVEEVIDAPASDWLVEVEGEWSPQMPEEGFLHPEAYSITGYNTVADLNPDFDTDDPVVIGRYLDSDSGKKYAFPAGRLA